MNTRAKIKKLDRIFSIYIRKRERKGEMVRCYTCGRWLHWKEATVGHYIKRQYYGVRWDERNVKIQCRKCNYLLQGNDLEFARRLVEEYGENILNILEIEKKKSLRSIDLDFLIDMYQKKVEEL